jgi:DNA modification methylase
VEPCIKAGCPEGGAVLDPFAGSGTTALVAQALSRRAILIDLSVDYLDQALHRNRQTPMGLVG